MCSSDGSSYVCSSELQSLRAADRREGQDRRFQRRPVEVEAARLIAARIARIDHQVVDRLVRQDRGAGEFVLAPFVVDRHAIEFGGRIALAAEADERPGERARGRSEEHTSELQSLMRISYAVFCLKK